MKVSARELEHLHFVREWIWMSRFTDEQKLHYWLNYRRGDHYPADDCTNLCEKILRINFGENWRPRLDAVKLEVNWLPEISKAIEVLEGQ